MARQHSDAIQYTSLNSAIYLGQYDGSATASEVIKYGDFGLGSEERLAGELILLNGIMYSIPASGRAMEIKPESKIPFAAVKFFKPEKTISVTNTFATLKQLEQYLDSIVNQNGFAAIKVTAIFSYIKFRSFYEQQKPYSKLQEATAAIFEHENFTGTLVGFYTPKAAEVLNSPVYHFHVLDKTRQTGGHLLECAITSAKIEIDYASHLVVDLPSPGDVNHIDLNQTVKKD
jgi:acetolactate decarboxylase